VASVEPDEAGNSAAATATTETLCDQLASVVAFGVRYYAKNAGWE
jgi:hypothetical protein